MESVRDDRETQDIIKYCPLRCSCQSCTSGSCKPEVSRTQRTQAYWVKPKSRWASDGIKRNLTVTKLARWITRKKILGHRLAYRAVLVFSESCKVPNKLQHQFPILFLISQGAHYPSSDALASQALRFPIHRQSLNLVSMAICLPRAAPGLKP